METQNLQPEKAQHDESSAVEEQAKAQETSTSASEEKAAEATESKTTKKRSVSEIFKNYFTATRISYIAVFTALSYVLYLPFFEFSLFPAVPFLKVDFSNSFVLIAGYALGPVAGVVVGVVKELLHALTFSQTIGIGEIANILIMLPYVLVPSIIYKKRKGIKTVIVTLIGACFMQAVWSVPVNYLLTFPFFWQLYMGASWAEGMEFYLSVWYWAVLFNLIKTVLVSVLTMLLYKPLSKLIKLTAAKFEKRKLKK